MSRMIDLTAAGGASSAFESRLHPSSSAPAGPQPRRPSGARPPPTSSSSSTLANHPVPVRAELYNPPQSHRPTPPHSHSSPHQSTPRHFQPPHMVHRPSMPSPKSTLLASAATIQNGLGSNQSSMSSRPSPYPDSDGSLKETTRHNIQVGRDGMGHQKGQNSGVRGQLPDARLASANPHKGSASPRGQAQSARQASANLQWDVKSPKTPEIATPREAYVPRVEERDEVDINFENLLDSLQVPLSVREKFATVSPAVKVSILSSATSSNPTILTHLGLPLPSGTIVTPKIKKRLSTPLLRKAKSSSSLQGGIPQSSGTSPQVGKTYRVDGDSFTIVASPNPSSSATVPNPHPLPHAPVRGQSIDVPRQQVNRLSAGPSSGRPLSGFFTPASLSRSTKIVPGLGISLGAEQPESFVSWLQAHKATDLGMDVAKMKKLRMVLRHENTAWLDHFLNIGGYKLVLARLKEMVDVEWREEQHDDQMLYELLRCVKALGTSEVGKTALRYHYPEPFNQLSTLLFSEKKPGDLPSRQLIIELWVFLFDLFPSPPPSSSSPSTSSSTRPISVRFEPNQGPSQFMAGTERTRRVINAAEEVKGLLVPDVPDKTAEILEFVKIAHRPRVYRCWMSELGDICRDYFWIMCHGSNSLWAADEVDERLVEKPVAPGGATGGVEFEAMNYVTVHLKLLNRLCKTMAEQDREKAGELHRDLFQSGMDRILVTLRKASTTFYPALHLELARYVRHLQLVSPNARLPHLIDKLVGSPPEMYRKQKAASSHVSSRNQGGARDSPGQKRISNPPSAPGLAGGQGQGQVGQVGRQGQSQSQDQGSGTRIWLEDARKGGKVQDGGRRGAYDMQV